MSSKRFLIRKLIPPLALQWLDRAVLRRTIRLTGNHASWTDAVAASDGYDDPRIIDRVAAAARAVRDGQAAYDQDGVTFAESSPDWPLAAILLTAAAEADGRLSVLDFGGALGNSWRRAKPLLVGLPETRWAIVEQPSLVDIGRREFQDGQLAFFDIPKEAVAKNACNVLLLGSVLQYLPSPWQTLHDLLGLALWQAVVVHRTPVWNWPDRLAVQETPRCIYGVPIRYPSWVFNAGNLDAALSPFGRLISLPAEEQPVSLSGSFVHYVSIGCLRGRRPIPRFPAEGPTT